MQPRCPYFKKKVGSELRSCYSATRRAKMSTCRTLTDKTRSSRKPKQLGIFPDLPYFPDGFATPAIA
jgi:hypothetical protein